MSRLHVSAIALLLFAHLPLLTATADANLEAEEKVMAWGAPEKFRDNLPVRLNWAVRMFEDGKYDAAIAEYEAIMNLWPDLLDHWARCFKGKLRVMVAKGDMNAASAFATAVLSDFESNPRRGHRLNIASPPIYLELKRDATHELRSSKRHHLLPGVLSSRMWIKQRNHHVESLLEKWAEPFSAIAELLASAGICQTNATEALPTMPAGDRGGDACLAPITRATGLLLQTWRYLLQNQAHDSICGCSIDQVHREMTTRFDWAAQIGKELAAQALAKIAAAVGTQPEQAEQDAARLPLVVFNPLSHARADLVTLSLQLPGSLEKFSIVDEAGRIVPHQVVLQERTEFASVDLDRQEILGLRSMVETVARMGLAVQEVRVSGQGDRALIDVTLINRGRTDPKLVARAYQQVEALLAERVTTTFHVRAHLACKAHLCFVAQDVPGCGYRTFFLVTASDGVPGCDGQGPASVTPRSSEAPTSECRSHRMENEFLRVDVDPSDGTVSLLHKPSGVKFIGLHRFVDGGERGDEYNHCPPEDDCVILRPTSPPEIRWVERGPARYTIEVKQRYRVPASLSQDRGRRSDERVDMPITTWLCLSPGVPRLDMHTEVENQACDHLLRVHFPTPLRADCSEAEGAFDVLRRPLGLPSDSADWAEPPVATHPQRTFVDVSDGRTGLMVANRGLPEFEVLTSDGSKAEIALTLLRCVGWLSRDDLSCRPGNAGPSLETPDAQCLGHSAFDYSLIPHEGTWRDAYHHAHAFDAPLWAVAVDAHPAAMPLAQSLIGLCGEGLVLSAVKGAEAGDGVIVRFYNILSEPTKAVLRTIIPPRSATMVNLVEEEVAPLDLDSSGAVTLQTRGRQIVTVKLTF